MKNNKTKGITLIALVVTIVVLLILAGVTLTILFGENGMINQAKKAEQEQKIAEYKDKFDTARFSAIAEKRGNITVDDFIAELKKEGIITDAQVQKNETDGSAVITPEEGIEIKVKPTLDGKDIQIEYPNGAGTTGGGTTGGGDTPTPPEETVTYPEGWDKTKVDVAEVKQKTGDTTTVKVPVPKGFTISKIVNEQTIDNGLVIYEIPESEKETVSWTADTNTNTFLDVQENYNQFVWIPVADPSEMYGVTTAGKHLGKLYDFGSYNSSEGKFIAKNPLTALNWTETEGKISWTLTSGNGSNREPDVVSDYDNTASNYTAAEFKEQLEEEFKAMKDSVEKYKGFYIGRYETGSIGTAKAKVTKNNSDIAKQTWYTMYQKNKEMIEGKTSMIWGSQWDACLKWFLSFKDTEGKQDVATYVTDSTGKGNYKGTQGDTNKLIPTGSNDSYSVNNIYDMAGNAWDWTIEARNTGYRDYRRRLLLLCRL